MLYLQYVVYGLVTGSILLLGTVGFSMIRRTDNFLNIAHGQMVALGAYFAYVFFMVLHLPLILSAALSIAIVAFLGWLSDKLVFSPIRGHGGLYLLFTSVGLAYVIHGTVEATFGARPKALIMGQPAFIRLNGEPIISSLEIIIIASAVCSAAALHFFLTRTRAGMAVRALSSEYDLARVRGVNTKSVSALVWILASALAGLAGVLMGIQGTVYSDMGWAIILVILSAAILGGLGSIYGVMVGSMLIGIGMDVSVIWIPPAYRSAVAFMIIMLVLVVRPQGIFGGESRG